MKILYGLAALLTGVWLMLGVSGCSSDKTGMELSAEESAELSFGMAGTLVCHSGQEGAAEGEAVVATEKITPADGGTERSRGALSHADVMAILMPYDTVKAHNPYEQHFDSMPPGGIKMKINGLGGSLGRVFNDSNKFHIAVAEQGGISPLYSLRDVWREAPKLERLRTCEAYFLDDFTHSLPYLTPRAHELLTDIGLAFRDSLRSRGGGYYRVKVTSVLRTPSQVKRLRRRNRNAVDTSAHLYGTTFDISYLKFICDSTQIPRTQEDMKNLLGEVVEDMRRRERCYVKYERKQACYHITARP